MVNCTADTSTVWFLLLVLTFVSPDSSQCAKGVGRSRKSAAPIVLDTGGKDPLGHTLYAKNCALCHGEDRQGEVSNYPGLLGVRSRLTDTQILANINNGKGRMPAIPKLISTDTTAILRFLGPPMVSVEQSDKT